MSSRNPYNQKVFNLKRRVRWLALTLFTLALYFPINRLVEGGITLKLPIDGTIPLFPAFILPYLLATLLFVLLPVWAAFHIPGGEFESYILGLLLATIVSYFIYLIFPTYVSRPDVTGQDIFSRAIVLLYRTDQAHNAAPSGHTFYALLSAFFLTRWRPRFFWLWLAITVLILASTVFTRQHNLLDLAAGIVLAISVLLFVNWLESKRPFTFAS